MSVDAILECSDSPLTDSQQKNPQHHSYYVVSMLQERGKDRIITFWRLVDGLEHEQSVERVGCRLASGTVSSPVYIAHPSGSEYGDQQLKQHWDAQRQRSLEFGVSDWM